MTNLDYALHILLELILLWIYSYTWQQLSSVGFYAFLFLYRANLNVSSNPNVNHLQSCQAWYVRLTGFIKFDIYLSLSTSKRWESHIFCADFFQRW